MGKFIKEKGKEMKVKTIIPSIIFFIAVLYLIYSGLTISKAIESQTEVFSIFVNSLAEKDILLALSESLSYVILNIILPLLPFLFLIAFGFLTLFWFKIEIKFLFAAQILFLVASFFLSNFSITILLTYIGIIIGNFVLLKTFQPSKKIFLTGSSLTSKGLRFLNMFLAVGLFFSLYVNFQSYEGQIIESNANLIETVVPTTTQLQDFQLEIVNTTADELKLSIQNQYELAPSGTKEQCKPVYDSIIAGVEDYKNQMNERMKDQEIGDIQEEVIQSFPIIGQLINATPLFLAISLFALLEVLRPIVSLLFGAVHSLATKSKKV